MNRVMCTLACVLALSFAPILGGSASLFAQPFHDEIRKSLVYLHAKGQAGPTGPNASQWVDSYATGFLVSTDGLILTVYHLFSKLGNVVPETVTVEARIRDMNANVLDAALVDAAVTMDLLLLKIPPGAEPYVAVTLGSAFDHDATKPIYTSGFSQQIGYRAHHSQIHARTGPGGSLWTTGFSFQAGESGSPIYDDKGQVLGLVKGDHAGTGQIVPIGFADSLLAQVRLRKIQEAMKDFDVLRRQFDWAGEVIERAGRRLITISYEKRVAGDPQVTSIDLNVRVVGINKDKEEEALVPFPLPRVARTAPQGESGGIFESPELAERVEELKRTYSFSKVTELEVDLVPTLTDGSKLLRKRIVIKY